MGDFFVNMTMFKCSNGQLGITKIAFVSGEPGTEISDSFRVLTTEIPSHDNYNDDDHDEDVPVLLRCLQNVR